MRILAEGGEDLPDAVAHGYCGTDDPGGAEALATWTV